MLKSFGLCVFCALHLLVFQFETKGQEGKYFGLCFLSLVIFLYSPILSAEVTKFQEWKVASPCLLLALGMLDSQPFVYFCTFVIVHFCLLVFLYLQEWKVVPACLLLALGTLGTPLGTYRVPPPPSFSV